MTARASMAVDVSGWAHVGSSDNAEFYVFDPHVLAVVPHDNCTDDARTARQSLAFQTKHWESVGHRGAAVVFMDPILVQEGGARDVYSDETRAILTTCFALVGETFFGRAAAAVFTGLARPGIPTMMFRTLEDARPWIAEMNKARGV